MEHHYTCTIQQKGRFPVSFCFLLSPFFLGGILIFDMFYNSTRTSICHTNSYSSTAQYSYCIRHQSSVFVSHSLLLSCHGNVQITPMQHLIYADFTRHKLACEEHFEPSNIWAGGWKIHPFVYQWIKYDRVCYLNFTSLTFLKRQQNRK